MYHYYRIDHYWGLSCCARVSPSKSVGFPIQCNHSNYFSVRAVVHLLHDKGIWSHCFHHHHDNTTNDIYMHLGSGFRTPHFQVCSLRGRSSILGFVLSDPTKVLRPIGKNENNRELMGYTHDPALVGYFVDGNSHVVLKASDAHCNHWYLRTKVIQIVLIEFGDRSPVNPVGRYSILDSFFLLIDYYRTSIHRAHCTLTYYNR